MQCCIAPSHSLKAERQRSRQLIWWFGLMTMQRKKNKKMDRWVTLWLNGIQGNRSERETEGEKKKPEGEKVRWSGQGWQEGEFAHLISSDSSDYVSTRLFDTSPIFSLLPCLVLSSALLVIGCLWLRHVMIIMQYVVLKHTHSGAHISQQSGRHLRANDVYSALKCDNTHTHTAKAGGAL